MPFTIAVPLTAALFPICISGSLSSGQIKPTPIVGYVLLSSMCTRDSNERFGGIGLEISLLAMGSVVQPTNREPFRSQSASP